MRAHITTSSMSTRRPRSAHYRPVALAALVFAVGLLAIPATAQAYVDQPASGDQSDRSSVPPASVSDASTAPYVGTAPGAESPSAGPASELPTPDTYLGQSGITLPAGDDVVASSSPVSVDDGFDWASALIGAGVAMAIAALSGAAFLTVRRRTALSPSGAS
jgi:hypothetical protein